MLKVEFRCSDCGKLVKAGLRVSYQKPYYFKGVTVLQTGLAMLSDLRCPNCGSNIGYISSEDEEKDKDNMEERDDV